LRDAYYRDYDVVLVEDCCASGTPQGHRMGVTNVKNIYGLVLPSRKLMSQIRGRKSDGPQLRARQQPGGRNPCSPSSPPQGEDSLVDEKRRRVYRRFPGQLAKRY